MDPSGIRAPGGERWLRRAERVTDAFGLVLLLVLVTFVLTSLVDNSGWGSVLIMAATGATAIVALTSSHAPPHYVHIAIYLSAVSLLLSIVADVTGADLWLNLGAVLQVSLLLVAMVAVLGDSAKARSKLGWAPRMGLEELVASMVDADMRRVSHEY